jgi:hypothetical protein
MFFALLSCSSLRVFVVWCCVSFLCMSLAMDSANGGFVSMFCIFRVVCLVLDFLYCIWWFRQVYVGLCAFVSFGVVWVRRIALVDIEVWVDGCYGECEVWRSPFAHCESVLWEWASFSSSWRLCSLFVSRKGLLFAVAILDCWVQLPCRFPIYFIGWLSRIVHDWVEIKLNLNLNLLQHPFKAHIAKHVLGVVLTARLCGGTRFPSPL